jgi:hypothetical protein
MIVAGLGLAGIRGSDRGGRGVDVLMATKFVMGQAVKRIPSKVAAAGGAVVMRTLQYHQHRSISHVRKSQRST